MNQTNIFVSIILAMLAIAVGCIVWGIATSLWVWIGIAIFAVMWGISFWAEQMNFLDDNDKFLEWVQDQYEKFIDLF